MNNFVGFRHRKVYEHIGAKIRALREDRGWSGEKLCVMLGYDSRATLSHYENGKRKISAFDLYRLSLIFNVSIDSFFPKSGN